MNKEINYRQADVLVIGSEGAGGRAAISAAEYGANVIIATKGRMGRSGATVTAIAGIAVDGQARKKLLGLPADSEDTAELFFGDIVVEGKLINNQKMVQRIVEDGPSCVKDLMDWGMKVVGFSEVPGPGHSYPRDIYTTGRQIVSAIKRKAKTYSNIQVLEDLMLVALLHGNSRVIGAVGLNLKDGQPEVISAGATILATGGGQTVYPNYTAPDELSGDGQVMALEAGAELVDMEMIQFHPFDFIFPPAWKGIGFPFTFSRDLNVWLLNRRGERFMQKWDENRMEHSTRDVLSIAVMNEILEGRGSPHGGVYMSTAHLPHNIIEHAEQWLMLGVMNPGWRFGGFKFDKLVDQIKSGYAMEVSPACHFFMGGVHVDESCQTTIPGLFAVGEVSGGMNGANRLSNLALTQVFVQGTVGGYNAAVFAKSHDRHKVESDVVDKIITYLYSPIQRKGGINPFKLKKKIQELAWTTVGVIRDGSVLRQSLKEIETIKESCDHLFCKAKESSYNRGWIEALQACNLIHLVECIIKSALTREESRGAHYRKDFTSRDDNTWIKNVVLYKNDQEILVNTIPIERSDSYVLGD